MESIKEIFEGKYNIDLDKADLWYRTLTDSKFRRDTALGRKVAKTITLGNLEINKICSDCVTDRAKNFYYEPSEDEDNRDVKTDPSLVA